jgi:uncharacterized membrane protein
MSRSYTSSPPQAPPWRVAGLLLIIIIIIITNTIQQNIRKRRQIPLRKLSAAVRAKDNRFTDCCIRAQRPMENVNIGE